ncbi:MAG: MFS transporter [Clostridiales Family XIII bacterium]|jgi:hypothetical protein|nr:MFS transporter [Clostridiales Family XIII bacterium]
MKNILGNRLVRAALAVILAGVFAYGGNIVCKALMHRFWGDSVLAEPNNVERIGLLFVVFLFLFLHFVIPPRELYARVYRFRFLLAAVLFVCFVLLEVHGSSIGVWNSWVQPGITVIPDAEPIFGTVRTERTDEFIVYTPLAFSQAFTGYAEVNSIAEAWPTNMLTVYNQPVADVTLLAKPFYWGYVLFGTAKGLAWFWCGRFIALFLVTFEMFMLLTKGRKAWAVAAAFLISFAPAVQWWYAINFFVEMLVFGQLAVIACAYFLRESVVWKKLAWTVAFALSACAYIFALYPAWMVPLAYLFAALFLWALAANFRAGPRSRKEWLYVLLAAAIVLALVLYWYHVSKDAIALTQNTVYPGQRRSLGGGEGKNLFNYFMNLRLPYIVTDNYSGGAVFPGFFPVGEILAAILLVKTRAKDKLLIGLLAVNAFLICYAAAGFPEWLAKASLLIYSHAWATAIVSTCVSVFILIRALSQLSSSDTIRGVGLRARVIPAALIVFVLISGASVNPFARGIEVVTEKPLYKEVQALQAEDPGTWIGTWPLGNYLIMAGAPTINSTNILPALGRWEILDPAHEHMDAYNRYAHLYIGYNNEETTFEEGGEILGIELAMKDLEKLGVRYLCLNESQGELPAMEWDGGRAEKIYEEGGVRIFRISYGE